MGAWGTVVALLLVTAGCAPAAVPPAAVPPVAVPPAAVAPETRQLVVVSSATYAATTATLATYQKVGGTWRPALGAMPARIGAAGFTDHKVEGDGKTPTGGYRIGTTMYGIAPDPGVRYRYHRLVPGDYWNENPGTAGYNSFVHGADPGAGSEALWRISPQYTYFAVIGYNVPARPGRGSAIFLHELHPGHATAGCVSLEAADLVRVLRWLDPAASPRIVMAPRPVPARWLPAGWTG